MSIAGFVAIAAFRRRRCAAEARKEHPCNGELPIPGGRLLVCPAGVQIVPDGPSLAGLSRHCPWRWVPSGIAAMELLVYDIESAAPLVYRYLSPEEVDILDRELNSIEEVEDEDGQTVIEHDSDVVESIVRMVELAPILGGKCPYRSVSRDLEQLPAWNYQQLESYVSQRLMG